MTGKDAWVPRSGREEVAGCAWLPRLIDKARRQLESKRTGRDQLSPYMFGDNDFMDAKLLSFLKVSGSEVLDVLWGEPDDRAAAAEIVRRSGRTHEECASWSAEFQNSQRLPLAVFDANEGRRAPGLSTTLMRLCYNRILMPPVAWWYRRAERRGDREGGS